MYERFTDRARKVMQLANQEAQRLRHEYVGTEHVLLGLIKEGNGVAANVLKNLDIDLNKVRREVERIVQHGPPGESSVDWGRLPRTPRTQKVIDYSVEESRRLKHNYVGTEHLLLGLLRDQEGVAAQILMNLGLKLEGVREEVLNLLGQNLPTVHLAAQADKPPEPAGPTVPPGLLSAEQVQAVRDLIERIAGQKEASIAAQDFAQAARCRDEEHALNRLLAWYEWFREYP